MAFTCRSVQFGDCLECARWAIFGIFILILVSVANESKGGLLSVLAFVVLDSEQTEDVTVLSEDFLELCFIPSEGEVLDVDVVH